MKRNVAKWIYSAIGWKVDGEYPYELKKKILIVAPHTSSMDFFVGILVKIWYNIECKFYAKQELFKGLTGWALRKLGGIPVDRSRNANLVSQAVQDFQNAEEHTILLTPEGTRKKVQELKTGFYYIARQAGVPIIPVIFDFERRLIRIKNAYYTTENMSRDMAFITNLYRGVKGKNAELGIS